MLNRFINACTQFPDKTAFVINGNSFTYTQLSQKISDIRTAIFSLNIPEQKLIGVVAEDDFDTYASLLAAMFSGCGYVPLLSHNPIDRNESIAELADLKLILTPKKDEQIETLCSNKNLTLLETKSLSQSEIDLSLPLNYDEQLAYILFTSGSTGVPKGVPITMKNLEALIQAFLALGYSVSENDRFMQMFELTFDFSVFTTFAPLCIGASVHTVSSEGIKFANVYTTLEEQNITFAAMVPSVINYLRPYFEEMNFENLKYSLFCGEALIADVAKEWKQCSPNGVVVNAYGPTEATVFCMMYDCHDNMNLNKTYNGSVSIGKAMLNTDIIVVDENLKALPSNEKGELCITSAQLTPGYWKDEEKNKEAFFKHIVNGKEKTFYRSGDLALYDDEGDFMFGGRLDYQVKLYGFRVELGEIEHHARTFSGVTNTAALVYETETGSQMLYLLLENYDVDFTSLKEFLATKVPHYMVPSKIFSLPSFPFNNNGKVDRKVLQNKLKELGET
ncbi:MAG: hypothetical protein AUK34_11090 [Ignavibacteria bacterium CG2_30_36_16]|nr:MAG: hypothetical protein AUK34_11090 [Ignavibacteria bacterium CG2_30_36_16]